MGSSPGATRRRALVAKSQGGLAVGEEEMSPAPNGGSDNAGRRGWRRKRRGVSLPSPRCLLPRWMPCKLFLKCRNSEGEKEEVVADEEGVEGGCVSCVSSLGSAAGAEPVVPAGREEEVVSTSEAKPSASEGGQHPVHHEGRETKGSVHMPQKTYVNIGMGASLVLLLTRSVTEFNKMIELRSEMEILLKEVKEAVQKKGSSPNTSDLKNNPAFSCSDSWGDTEQCNDIPTQGPHPCLKSLEAPCTAKHYSHPIANCKKDYEDAKSLRIDQMEAELESELEILQLKFHRQDSSDQHGMELPSEKTVHSEGFSVNLGGHSGCKERVVEEVDGRDHYGVCPYELTRRLHELLETRQEERITELETALQLAHIKLHEKEMEVCWWRDTARLVSQHKEETLFR
uniref:tRNA-specific 2-thiouridylase mnmA n=1 Tax=Anthurium amnicola TaxID=1678845 RepID=A0A1D1Y7A2_9ARAE